MDLKHRFLFLLIWGTIFVCLSSGAKLPSTKQKSKNSRKKLGHMASALLSLKPADRVKFRKLCLDKKKMCKPDILIGKNATLHWKRDNVEDIVKLRFWNIYQCTFKKSPKSCPVDGGWAVWSRWNRCSNNCGPGKRSRNRSCADPSPQNGGLFCHGRSFEKKRCIGNCRLNKGWLITYACKEHKFSIVYTLLTPLGVAYLKGHRGLSEILLDLPGIDIDFKDEGGKTLLLNEAAKWGENQYKNICKLVKDKGASCTVVDNDGNGALHLIAKQTLPFKVDESEAVVQNWISDTLKVVELLLENGCEVNAENDKTTPIMLAIKQLQHAPADVKSHPLITRNLQLIKLLLSKMAEVPDQEDLFGENILHMIAEHCVMKPVGMELLDLLLDMEKIENKKSGESSSKLQDMARVRSGANITPLMAAGFVYKSSSYTTIDEKHPRELIEGIWVTGRAFIKKLIDVFNSEVEYSFEEKNGDKITIIHKSLMFYMVDSNEIGMTVDGEYKRYPGLEMILKYNPTIDLPTKEQQTALMVSVINDDYIAADLLVLFF
ncbi:uncharacterized protein LOC106161102 [Lingula anatina]|uniref:Uncharacterized protein LOC106161102 n=1 Tax=Lingula anatina TaxID=7574 RepID=A0A1S3I567_LINAN|nr:uncharacterized protein LOC106161102 [Lingula anatina]|eukprot:XP_013393415.1 uncharacterized protein LOC106161102 [Lingula anatina]